MICVYWRFDEGFAGALLSRPLGWTWSAADAPQNHPTSLAFDESRDVRALPRQQQSARCCSAEVAMLPEQSARPLVGSGFSSVLWEK